MPKGYIQRHHSWNVAQRFLSDNLTGNNLSIVALPGSIEIGLMWHRLGEPHGILRAKSPCQRILAIEDRMVEQM